MTAGLFPGQGIPAKVVVEALPREDRLLRVAENVLGYDIGARVRKHSGGLRPILPTSVAQPAIFVASMIGFREARREGRSFDAFLGHSLGELAALVAGGALSFRDGLRVVQVRADAMQKAADLAPGGMAALIGVPSKALDVIARATGVTVANDNAPGQVVIAGTEHQLTEAARLTREVGGRCVLLELKAAFHTAAMRPAQDEFLAVLDQVPFRTPWCPVVSNVTASAYRSPGEIRRLLVMQLVSRVRFQQSVRWLWSAGYRDFVDLGPGQVVGALASRTIDSLDDQVMSGV